MFCKNCGKEVYESSGTCPYCGVNLSNGMGKDMQDYRKPPEKNKNQSVIIVSVVCVLLVVITITVIAFFMGKNSKEDDDYDNDKKTEEVVEYKTTRPSYTRVEVTEAIEVTEVTEKEESTTFRPSEDERFNMPDKVIRKTDDGTETYERDADSRKVSLHIAAANDGFIRGDSFYPSSKAVTSDKIGNITKHENYAKFVYNKKQVIKFDDNTIEYTEVLIAFEGEYKDTLIFILNGNHVGSYDVEKGEQNAKGLSDRVYVCALSK